MRLARALPVLERDQLTDELEREKELQVKALGEEVAGNSGLESKLERDIEPAILTPAAPTPQQRPAVPERQLPATPAAGASPLSSESTVPMLWWLWRYLTPAQTVLVCLWCPTSCAHDIHCIDTGAVVTQRRRPVYSTQYSNRLQRRSIHSDSSPGRPKAGR